MHTQDGKIFVNRTLDLSSIKAVGFDLDHTLVRYRRENFEALAFKKTLEKHGLPLNERNLVSGNDGLFDPELIYLDYGRSYTLTETKSPDGYIGLPQSLKNAKSFSVLGQGYLGPIPVPVIIFFVIALSARIFPKVISCASSTKT